MKLYAAILFAGAVLAGAASAAAPVTVTLVASATVVQYGKPVNLSGQLSTKRANQSVTIQATECGSTRQARTASAKTNATGAYTVAVTPALATAYQATFKNVKSPAVTVSVKPVLQLTRVARGSYSVKVTAGQALTGKAVLFQRYAKLRKRWVQVKRVTLAAATPGPTKPTMITPAAFKAKVARGTRVRVVISKAQAAPCYVTAASNAVRA